MVAYIMSEICKYKLRLAMKLLIDLKTCFFNVATLHERTIFLLCAIADVVEPEYNAILWIYCVQLLTLELLNITFIRYDFVSKRKSTHLCFYHCTKIFLLLFCRLNYSVYIAKSFVGLLNAQYWSSSHIKI